MRSGEVMVNSVAVGLLKETENGFQFQYYKSYVENPDLRSVSLTLPKQIEAYTSSILFPFFAGLLTEGQKLLIFVQSILSTCLFRVFRIRSH